MFPPAEKRRRSDLIQDSPRPPRPYTASEAAAILEMQQKIYFYGWCIDHRDFAALDALFLPDSIVHYDLPDGARLPWSEMREWLPQGLSIFRITQHNMSNPLFELDGDNARSRTYGDLLHVQELTSGDFSVMRHHSIYHDEWLQVEGSWRIAKRTLTNLHVNGPVLRDSIVSHHEAKPT